MKWSTKKRLYQYTSRLVEIGSSILPKVVLGAFILLFYFIIYSFDLIQLLFTEELKGKESIDIIDILICLFLLCVTLFFIFCLLPFGLERVAKKHSYKKIPVLKKLEQIQVFLLDNYSRFFLTEQLLEKIEGSFLEEKNYPITERTITFYKKEIDHICEIIKNAKKIEPAMVDHAASRAKKIAIAITESIEIDEEAHIHSIKARKVEIAQEWTEVYESKEKGGVGVCKY